jgi:hypothetical protein
MPFHRPFDDVLATMLRSKLNWADTKLLACIVLLLAVTFGTLLCSALG